MFRTFFQAGCLSILLTGVSFAEDANTPSNNKEDSVPAVTLPLPPLSIGSSITLEAAVERALAESPRLKSFGFARAATDGRRSQAGALPNPEFGIDAENFSGQGAYRGLDSAEVTYGFSQLLEIGGKRDARKEIAFQGYKVASREYDAARLDVIRDVTIAYAEAVAAKEALALAEKQKAVAGEVLDNVTERVNAAAEPLFQRSKSVVAYASSEMALDKARRDNTIARNRLAATWGAEELDGDVDSAGFFQTTAPAPMPAFEELKRNPDFAKWEAEVSRSKASFELEQANAIPDPSLSLGVRDFRDSGDWALMAGISIPLPVFNLNSGNIESARQEVSKTESDKDSASIDIMAELTRSSEELENAYRRAVSLKETVIPAAEKAFSLSRFGYRAGKFPYLEVLDAQRTLVETRIQYNESLRDYHVKRAEVERLTGKHFAQINQEEGEDE